MRTTLEGSRARAAAAIVAAALEMLRIRRFRPPRLGVPVALEEGLAVACMALLVLITLINVLIRYFTDESFAWTEEISIFLMVVMTLAGASAAAARDRHIRIEYFYDSGTAARKRRLQLLRGLRDCAAVRGAGAAPRSA